MPVISATDYSEKQQRSAQRTLEMLDRMDSRMEEHYATIRKHHRREFRGQAILCLPPTEDNPLPVKARVWTRSISESGLSFICPAHITDDKIIIGLDLPNGKVSWLHAEIRRRKEIPNEQFWEYGVAFRGRAEV
ncbi:PilZ domain-containing protein [Calycomorphotria hydatis]|uniref:PilZ domain-containing protein n=1 Tax=Calycomorphotria hydatis TaxID=2528027 RepID=A0A517T483_9PLAN|nr:PilZ domain-containing protein [Calycomorphotria hydatis]QDT63185.1 hypothetical protein V22_04030 [Calycomorphotria hydatis]